jgi:DNA-binding transcriptional MocR family regulator
MPFDGLELFHAAFANQIGIAPGIIFSAKADYRNCVRRNNIRLSAGIKWTTELGNAVRRRGKLAS